MSEAILDHHGPAVAAIVFYGSCLRQDTHEGVLDFYVLVDDYRGAYAGLSWLRGTYLRCINALVPPNVFYRSVESALGTLRCKYAVISLAAFERGVGPRSHHPYFWARFAQPALIVHARDEKTRERVAAAAAQAVLTLVQRLLVFLPAQGRSQRFTSAALWQEAFRRTYGSELRPESEDTIRDHYEADPDRYDAVAAWALATLAREGAVTVSERTRSFDVEMQPMKRAFGRARWHLERPYSRGLALLRLLKNATTFGDWLPYILWKLERHADVRLELTERQRRHPLIFGWPILARLLWRRDVV